MELSVKSMLAQVARRSLPSAYNALAALKNCRDIRTPDWLLKSLLTKERKALGMYSY